MRKSSSNLRTSPSALATSGGRMSLAFCACRADMASWRDAGSGGGAWASNAPERKSPLNTLSHQKYPGRSKSFRSCTFSILHFGQQSEGHSLDYLDLQTV